MSGQQGVFVMLEKYQGEWFNIRTIAEYKNMNYSQACRALNKMMKFQSMWEIEEKYEVEMRAGKRTTVKYYRYLKKDI